MRGFARIALLVIGFVLLAGVAPAPAQNKPLKGNWIFTVSVPGLGTFPVPLTLRHDGRRLVDLPPDPLPLVYREDGASFSLSDPTDPEFGFLSVPATATGARQR